MSDGHFFGRSRLTLPGIVTLAGSAEGVRFPLGILLLSEGMAHGAYALAELQNGNVVFDPDLVLPDSASQIEGSTGYPALESMLFTFYKLPHSSHSLVMPRSTYDILTPVLQPDKRYDTEGFQSCGFIFTC